MVLLQRIGTERDKLLMETEIALVLQECGKSGTFLIKDIGIELHAWLQLTLVVSQQPCYHRVLDIVDHLLYMIRCSCL